MIRSPIRTRSASPQINEMSTQTDTEPSLQLALQELSSKNEELDAIRGENVHLQQKLESAFQENRDLETRLQERSEEEIQFSATLKVRDKELMEQWRLNEQQEAERLTLTKNQEPPKQAVN